MSRDAAEALRLAIGAPQLDESFPEVAERRRLEYQESELMRAIESWQGRRTAAAQVRSPAGNHTTAAPRTLAFVNLQQAVYTSTHLKPQTPHLKPQTPNPNP